jgi:hypothetical protein
MPFSPSYNTTNPGAAVSNREDLTDILKVLAPEDTPIYSSLPHSKAKGTYHEWTMDTLASPSTDGVIEGSDVDSFADKFVNRVRVGNYVQKLRRSYMVSDIQEAVDSVGPAKYAQAEKKAGLELKRDIEATLLSTNDRVAGDSNTASKLRGLGDWIDSAGPSDVSADYRTPADSIHASGSFTETVLNSLITSIYRQSGKSQSLNLHADTALRAVISSFARTSGATDAVYRQVMQSAGKKLTNTVGMYESDNGIVTITNMNPVCAPDTTNKDTGYLLNMEFLGVADLIPMGTKGLQDLGGGKRGFVDWTGTLVVKHPGALGKITVLS